MTMVLTAVADGLCALLLQAQRTRLDIDPNAPLTHFLDIRLIVAMSVISASLYAYGMALNDVIDRRRDRQLASDRPLPSGRISVWGAHLICLGLALIALAAGAYFSFHSPGGWRTFLLIAFVGTIISIYDLAARYLVGPGLLLLGLIRFFHALIPASQPAMPWQPLLLLNHIVILAALGYFWDEKRPSLTRGHIWIIATGLAVIDAACLWLGIWRNSLHLQWGLLLPAICAASFIPIAWWIYHRKTGDRPSTQRVIRTGLLWLMIDDAAFVAGMVSWKAGVLLLLFIPLTLLGQHLLQWSSNLLALWRRPQYKRMRMG